MAKKPTKKPRKIKVAGEEGPERINPDLIELVRPIDAAKLDPKNARRHSTRGIESIARSLKEYGQNKPIVVDAAGIIKAGNGTYEAAKKLGWSRLAMVTFRGSKAKATGYAIADNRTGELSAWDEGQLAADIEELVTEYGDDFDTQEIGFTAGELAKLLGIGESASASEEAETAGDATEEPDEDDDGDEDAGEKDEGPAVDVFSVALSGPDMKTLRKAMRRAKKAGARTEAAQLRSIAAAYLDREGDRDA
jgi:hypothetical protein